jgi:hypothetical protein
LNLPEQSRVSPCKTLFNFQAFSAFVVDFKKKFIKESALIGRKHFPQAIPGSFEISWIIWARLGKCYKSPPQPAPIHLFIKQIG